jgi:ubiquinone/menaquinone biosynthesis C-methylase UbiE
MAEHGKDAARAVWGATPAGWTFGQGAEPGTREYFNAVIERRSNHEQPWLVELVPFMSFNGLRVLEVGCGAGYDAVAICAAGASYTGIDLAPQNISRTKAHLALFDLRGEILEADAEELPFADGSFDVVYSNGVMHHLPDMRRAFAEAHRVLRPGGEAYILVYNRHSVFYYVSLGLTAQVLKLGFLRRSLATRLRMIEATSSGELPIVNVYSRSEVRHLLAAAGFTQVATAVRKLTPEDLPQIRWIEKLWFHVPRRLLDLAGKRWGWYVIARAKRP